MQKYVYFTRESFFCKQMQFLKKHIFSTSQFWVRGFSTIYKNQSKITYNEKEDNQPPSRLKL